MNCAADRSYTSQQTMVTTTNVSTSDNCRHLQMSSNEATENHCYSQGWLQNMAATAPHERILRFVRSLLDDNL